jgi:hypothetical protein
MLQSTGRKVRSSQAWVLVGAGVIAAVAASLVFKLEGRDAFWLDESWTGAIVGQKGWMATLRQIYWDVNAPLYYLVLKLWSGLFGLSDWALRAPSVIAAACIPLAAALVPTPGLTWGQRLAWAAVLAFWFPTLCYAAEARCYALLLLVSTGQTVAFVRLLEAPSLSRAVSWSALAALAILVHYDALYLGAAQGLLYLAAHPRRATATWPAALLFLPVFAWLLFHWPRIREFARPDIAWYSPLRASELPLIGDYIADGGDRMPMWLAALGASALGMRLLTGAGDRDTGDRRSEMSVLLAIAASAIAAAVLVAAGFLRPSFTFRYLTPSEPGLLMGLVWLARRLPGRRMAPLTLSLLAVVYLGVSGWMLQHRLRMAPRRYNFEAASAMLARSHPERLIFLWDHPVDPVLKPEQLAALGGFFLHRAGEATDVTPVILRPGDDPNIRITQAASGAPESAVLWLYDRVVHGTAATRFKPQPGRWSDAPRCHDYGSARFGVLACEAEAPRADAGRSPSAPQAHQRGTSQPHG